MAVLATNQITVSWVKDISSVTWYYKLQASTAAKPAKPTTATPSGWSTEEPSYTEGSTNSLYICQKTTFSDGTFSYSDVSLSSSYEAAKTAYNKGVQATNAASAVSEAMGTIGVPYTEVEWVESTGKQYVFLDWKPPINTWGFEIDFINRNANSTSVGAWREDTNVNGFGTIFGTRNSSGVNDVELTSYSATGYLKIGGGVISGHGFKTDKTRQTMKLHGTTLTKPDGTTKTVTRVSETANKPYGNMVIFAYNVGNTGLRYRDTGGVSEPSTTRIYSLRFYEGDTLAVNLVGAIRKVDGTTGLYDKVSKHFYPAPGMLYGDEVGDIGDVDTMAQAMAKANPQAVVVNKNGSRLWRATVPFDKLEDGQKLTVTYSYNVVGTVETTELAGWNDTDSNSRVYLKLTLSDGTVTDWIPCYYSQTERLTTHYGAGIPINFTYRENIISSASATGSGYFIFRGFFADANYNTNQTNHILNNFAGKTGAQGIWYVGLFMRDGNGTYQSICTASDGTATSSNRTTAQTKKANTNGFEVGSPILYSDTNYNANSNITGGVYASYGAFDSRYSINSTLTANFLEVYKPIYLVGEIHADGLFYLDQTWWTQTPTTTGKVYVLIGNVYDSTTSNCRFSLTEPNPWLVYDGSKLVDYNTYLGNHALSAANGKNKVFHQSTAPAASVGLTKGDTWFDTSKGYQINTWNGSAWVTEQLGSDAIEDLSITNAHIANGTIQSAKIAQLDAGKVTFGEMKAGTGQILKILGPPDDPTLPEAQWTYSTFWNLADGAWQSHGQVENVFYEGGDNSSTGTDTGEWDIDVDVHIEDGAYTLTGTHQNTASYAAAVPKKETKYIQFGIEGSMVPAALTMGFSSYYYWQEPYAYSAFTVSGDRIRVPGKLYGTYDDEDHWEYGMDCMPYFNPAAYLTPTTLILGNAQHLHTKWNHEEEDPLWEDGELQPQFNRLQIDAGAINVEDSIIFEENVVFKVTENGEDATLTPEYRRDSQTGNVIEGAEAYYYRPVWPYKPGDTTTKTGTGDTYKIVCPGYLTDSKESIYFTVPLDRPVSEYVTSITLVSANCKVRQGGSYILGAASSTANIASSSYARVIRWSNHGLTIRLRKSSGSFSGTNNDVVMVDLLGLQFKFN